MWLPCVVLTIKRWRELRDAEVTAVRQAAIIARLKTLLGQYGAEARKVAERIAPENLDTSSST